jgi:hypothetical protein
MSNFDNSSPFLDDIDRLRFVKLNEATVILTKCKKMLGSINDNIVPGSMDLYEEIIEFLKDGI